VPLEGSIAGEVLRTLQVIEVDNTQQDPRHYTRLDSTSGFETQSILGVPMTARERSIGVLEVLNKRSLPWTEEDRTYLSILAAQAAVAIESAQLVEKLKRANRELSELDNLKNDFIAIASHELRTPLAVILGYASFLKHNPNGQVNEHATKVMNSALQLRRIIEDMTNLRYLKQGKAEIKREPIALAKLLDDVLADMRSLGETKGHTLVEARPPDVILYVDPIRVGMALTNVLNNAIRFTQSGGHITIESRLVEQGMIWISVTDNGIGLEPDQLERIFDEFYQVEDYLTRRHGGIGIGLSIARALIEANGGEIWANSPGIGQGATFTMTLPLAKSSELS
jgi:signal transduction histidine kinase